MIAEHEIGRHHLRDAGDWSGVLVRAGLDLRLSHLDGGLALRRPHRAGQRLTKRVMMLTAEDVNGRGRQRLAALEAWGCGNCCDDD